MTRLQPTQNPRIIRAKIRDSIDVIWVKRAPIMAIRSKNIRIDFLEAMVTILDVENEPMIAPIARAALMKPIL